MRSVHIHHGEPASISLVCLLFFSFKEHINHETIQYAFRFLGCLLFSPKIFEKKLMVLKCHLQKPSEHHFAQRPSWSPTWSCHLGNENKSNEVEPGPARGRKCSPEPSTWVTVLLSSRRLTCLQRGHLLPLPKSPKAIKHKCT